MHRVMSAATAMSISGLALGIGDFNPPSWRGGPNTTTQGWNFIAGAALAGQTPSTSLVALRNSNILPENSILFPDPSRGPQIVGVLRQQTNFHDTFMTLLPNPFDETPARMAFAIPTGWAAETPMVARLQIVYRTVAPLVFIEGFDGFERPNVTIQTLNNTMDLPDPDNPGWRRRSFDVHFSESTQWHMLVLMNDSIFLCDIDSVIVDTIVPAPGAGMVVGLGLMVACRRRR